MELNSFARIGKGVIHKAIGIQKNHKEIYVQAEDKLNEGKSGCYECEIYTLKNHLIACDCEMAANEIHSNCKTCSKAFWEPDYKIKYINEKNHYGYQPTLKSNAIKLLLLYHFLQPDERGMVKNVKIKDLASVIGCTTATIHSSNLSLQSYNYCYFCNSSKDCINIFLPEYKNYHLTAREGGQGYITLSSSLLNDLFPINHLNTLRISLKAILEVDTNSQKTENATSATTSFKKLQYFLPDYCRRNVIVKALEKNSGHIFNANITKETVTFHLDTKYSQKLLRTDMLRSAAEEIKIYIERLNNILVVAADTYDEQIQNDLLEIFSINKHKNYPLIELSEKDYIDLASLSIQYSLTLVQKTISIAYNYYTVYGSKVYVYGALIRTLLRNKGPVQQVS